MSRYTASRVSGFLSIALDSALFLELMRDLLSVKVDEILGHSFANFLLDIECYSIIHNSCSLLLTRLSS
jgi:hypothetical protein